jgi:hypothetical protein
VPTREQDPGTRDRRELNECVQGRESVRDWAAEILGAVAVNDGRLVEAELISRKEE